MESVIRLRQVVRVGVRQRQSVGAHDILDTQAEAAFWDDKMSKDRAYMPEGYFQDQSIHPEEKMARRGRENFRLGHAGRCGMIRGIDLAYERLGPNPPFYYDALDVGPGDEEFMGGWEPYALNKSMNPRYMEVSPWVDGKLREGLESRVARWRAQWPGYNPAYASSVLWHENVHNSLYDLSLWAHVAVVGFFRNMPGKRHFNSAVQRIGSLLSGVQNPRGARTLVFGDSLSDYNKGGGSRGWRPSVASYMKNLHLGSGCRLECEWVVKNLPYYQGTEDAKYVSIFLVRAA